MGYYSSMCYGYKLMPILLFILASFIFSLIFWLTKRWVDTESEKADEKKRSKKRTNR